MPEPHVKGDASASPLACGSGMNSCDSQPSQVLLVSYKMNTECNSQVVFFSCQFQSQVKCTSDNTPGQCDGFTCINSVEVS